MPSAENIKPDGRSLNLFIGRSRSGKSVAAYSYPHPMKVLDPDGRIRGGIAPSWIIRKDLDYVPIIIKGKDTVFDQINKELEALDVMCKTNQNYYNTIVLDSATWTAAGLLLDALPLTHGKGAMGDKGRTIGSLNMAGPSDYGFQSTGILQIMAFFKSLPIKNIIVTAHIVNRWGRRKDENGKVIDPYGPTEIIGEQLALTDKIAESLPTSFDNVFRFERIDTGTGMKYIFEGEGELASNTYGIPYGQHDITGKDFYKFLMEKAIPSQSLAGATVPIVK